MDPPLPQAYEANREQQDEEVEPKDMNAGDESEHTPSSGREISIEYDIEPPARLNDRQRRDWIYHQTRASRIYDIMINCRKRNDHPLVLDNVHFGRARQMWDYQYGHRSFPGYRPLRYPDELWIFVIESLDRLEELYKHAAAIEAEEIVRKAEEIAKKAEMAARAQEHFTVGGKSLLND